MSAREQSEEDQVKSFLAREPSIETVCNKLEKEFDTTFADSGTNRKEYGDAVPLMKKYVLENLSEPEQHKYAEGIY